MLFRYCQHLGLARAFGSRQKANSANQVYRIVSVHALHEFPDRNHHSTSKGKINVGETYGNRIVILI
jgi:hypothetical protein